MGVVVDHVGLFAQGARTTVALTLCSFALALVVGTVVAGFRVSPVPPLRVAGTAYVDVVRNTPLLVLLLLFYLGFTKLGIRYSNFTSAVIVLSAYTGAFVSEALRSGINSVATGQVEAARSLGLTYPGVLRLVVLPQAYRTVVAPLGNLFIALIKNSALASVISVVDLTRVADDLANKTARPIPAFLGAAVAYLLLALPAGLLVGVIERRVAIRR